MDNLEEIKVNEEDVAQDVVEESAQPKKKAKSLEVNKKTTIVAITVIMILIIASIIMAYVIPMGSYERFTNEDGNVELVKDSFSYDESLGRIAWWKVILAPFLVLGSEGSITLISILALLVVIGAIFNALDETEILLYAVRLLKHKYQDKKYLLLFLIPLLFMFLSTTAGVFEEIIPLIPVMVLFCYGFGWDSIIALAISVVPAAFGYTASVCNPFTIGIAQELVGIPMFSGVGLRLLTFVVGYIIIMVFVFPYAKKIDKNPQKSLVYKEDLEKKAQYHFEDDIFIEEESKSKAIKWVGCWFLSIIVFVVLSIFIQPTYIPALGDFALSNYILYIIIAIYIIAGLGACVISGFKGKPLVKALLKGMLTLLPVVGLVLIVSGIRYIIEEGHVMDTIIYTLIGAAEGKSVAGVIVIIYLAVLVLEMFVASGSAKAFLIMPMIGAICGHLGIDGQVACLAFIYGDGLTNTFMPTNAALLLMLGMTTVSYPKWFRWNLPMILLMFGATVGILMLGQFVVYA